MYFSNAGGEPPEELQLKFLEKYYMETPDLVPTEIFTRETLPEDERKALETLLSTKESGSGGRKNVRFITPRKGEKARLLDMCAENARHHLEEYLIQKQKRGEMARENPALEALRKTLRLEKTPARIECFDNSHLQGTDYASSMVCFVDGKPKKSDYRKFRLASFEGSDDYAAMKEAVTRRYGGSLSGELPLPDLVVIDGGKGQVNAARKSLDALGLEIPVIGLAKRLEEIFLPGKKDPYNLPKTSPALKLLQHIRDEAHRFAISYHRNLRRQRTLETSLTEIPGIGEKTAMKILRRFGSVEQAAAASEEELAGVAGKKNASAIRQHFRSRSGKPDRPENLENPDADDPVVTIP